MASLVELVSKEKKYGVGFNQDDLPEAVEAVETVETIVAQSTAVGHGGVGIVRVSGDRDSILFIIANVLKVKLKPRYAYYGDFYGNFYNSKIVLDKGIALYFAGPNSYTGEDILELHCHGGPIVIDSIINNILQLGARSAEPGEFTKRAWLNGKMDLTQVEAVYDLINATSEQAAQSAVNTLTGDFSKIINLFLSELINLRTYIEAAIDFSDEQIDFIQSGEVVKGIRDLRQKLINITAATKQGVILQEGLNIVIAGRPNAGKSSLLNILCRREEAIVTDIPGTTRDVIKANLNIQGVPVCLVDTAGLRQTTDLVEQEGVKRAVAVINKADFLLLILDGSLVENSKLLDFDLDDSEYIRNIIKQQLNYSDCNELNIKEFIDNNKFILVVNKVDEIQVPGSKAGMTTKDSCNSGNILFISAKENYGIDKLEELILHKIGFKQTAEGRFTARRRHLESLKVVEKCLNKAEDLLNNNLTNNLSNNIDLIAEELRHAQDNLSSITGEYTSDDLLGSIFSSFCIGK